MRNKSLLLVLIAVLAGGLVAAGCGSDDSGDTTAAEEVTAPQNAEEAVDQAQEALGDVPETVDEAVKQCIESAEASGLPSDQVDSLKQLCESGGDAANDAIDSAEGG
jgi:hypothetical protein